MIGCSTQKLDRRFVDMTWYAINSCSWALDFFGLLGASSQARNGQSSSSLSGMCNPGIPLLSKSLGCISTPWLITKLDTLHKLNLNTYSWFTCCLKSWYPETNHSNHSSSYFLCSMKMTIFWGYPLVSDPYLWQNCGHPGLLVRQIFAILLGSGNLHQYVGPFVGCFQKGERIMSQTSGSPNSRNFFVIVLSDKPLNFRGPQLSEIPMAHFTRAWELTPHVSSGATANSSGETSYSPYSPSWLGARTSNF